MIDLCDGQAVHAVAGKRDRYRPVEFCGGDPLRLAQHYLNLGVQSLYIADLDSIIKQRLQVESILSICDQANEIAVLVDPGWSANRSQAFGEAIERLADRFPKTFWISATESTNRTHELSKIVELVPPARVILGLDYELGELIAHDPEDRWVKAALELNLHGVVILDLASVGTGQGPMTTEICRRVKQKAPSLRIYSGGGIRSGKDARDLFDAGCERCLIATALQSS